MTQALVEALATPLAAWSARTLAPVDVAVIDSGVDSSHPDLQGRVAESFAVLPGEGGASVNPVAVGANNDSFGHGTGVAGIIAKVAPNARIHDYRVLGKDNQGAAACLLRALGAAVERRYPVINLSLALSGKFGAEARPLCEAAWRQGQVVVSAKRNMPVVDLGLPAEFATSVGVDIADLPDLMSLHYRVGRIIEFAALGDHKVMPAPGGGYTRNTGTSFATPVMSGLCAVMLGAFPGLLPFEVRSVLRHHAQEIAA